MQWVQPFRNVRSAAVGFLFVGIAIAYFERVGISQGMAAISAELKLTVSQEGLVFSAFSWGYVLFMLPAGYLVTRFGAARVFYIAVLLCSALAFAQSLTSSLASLVVVRMLLGMAEAPLFPACASIVKGTVRSDRRLGATAFFDSGSYIGAALAGPVIAGIVSSYGWRAAFGAQLVLFVLWLPLWIGFRATYSQSQLVGNRAATGRLFGDVARTRYVWLASAGFFLYNYSKAFFLTWLPVALLRQKGYDFLALGMAAAIPFALAFFAENFTALLADRFISRDTSRFGFARRAIFIGGFALAALIGAIPFSKGLVFDTLLLALAFAGLIATSGAIWSVPADFCQSEETTAAFGAIQNTISNCGGIVAPLIVASLVTGNDYSLAMWSVAGASLGALLIYGFLLPVPRHERSA